MLPPPATLLSLLRNNAYETKCWYHNEGGRREQPKMMVPQLRHVSSPAAVSTGKPSLLRKVRASAASRFPIQCETLSLLRKVIAVRKAAVYSRSSKAHKQML